MGGVQGQYKGSGRFGSAAPGKNGGEFLTPGSYLLEVVRIDHFDSKKTGGETCVIEWRVLETRVVYEGSLKPGALAKSVFCFDKGQGAAISDCKSAIAAAADIDPLDPAVSADDWNGILANASAGDGSSLAGARVVADATAGKLKNGNPFTYVKWTADAA